MRTSFLHGIIASLLLWSMASSAVAQPKQWEHNFYQGIGLANKFIGEDNQTLALHVGYGINYSIATRWSLMPGLTLRVKAFGRNNDFAGSCASTYLDFPLLLQYHFDKDRRNGVVIECGPVVSFLLHGEKHSAQSSENVASGKAEYRDFDLAFRPAVYYETGNWRFGVQSYISVLDTKCKYRPPYDHEHGFGTFYDERYDDPRITQGYHAFDVVATINYRW